MVTLNGTPISLILLSTDPNGIVTVAGDVSAFAGTTAELKFLAAGIFNQGPTTLSLDNISFSPLPAPEPGTLTLAGTAVAGLLGYRWRARRRR